MGLRTYGAAALTAVAALFMMAGPQREKSLLATTAPESIRALETKAANGPDDAEATRELAQAYLDARQPGLAVALVGVASAPVRDDVRVRHVYARALMDQGRSEEALGAEAGVLATCRPLVEGRSVAGCDTFLLASAVRRTEVLRELVSLGVEDALAHPEATLIAYQNATREARVMVQ
jgi:cytochrome c-type biogenesis protein CcmH/NrfG